MLEAFQNATSAISIIREPARSRIGIYAIERVTPPDTVKLIHNKISNQTTTTTIATTVTTTSILGPVTHAIGMEEMTISDVIAPILTIKGQEDQEGS